MSSVMRYEHKNKSASIESLVEIHPWLSDLGRLLYEFDEQYELEKIL
jgi:hypothetical protein